MLPNVQIFMGNFLLFSTDDVTCHCNLKGFDFSVICKCQSPTKTNAPLYVTYK